MREIKFRAWDEDNYRWCERGEILQTLDGDWRSNFGEHGTLAFSQFTGLKDKSGKEIYEDDFVDINGERCEVKYNPPSFAAYNAQKHEWNIQYADIEVIGNIYENPELLRSNESSKSPDEG
jgi:hypothetical protein